VERDRLQAGLGHLVQVTRHALGGYQTVPETTDEGDAAAPPV
jgi:hypothetical protein